MKSPVTLQKGKNLTPQENSIKIIITDDHRLLRTGVKNSLVKYSDIEVIGEAENGLDLLNKLENLSPDIIILNIQMPVMDGVETLPVLKKRFPGIKVIILSFLNDPAIICHMIKLGASSYITKESGAEHIYEAILACSKNWFFLNDTIKNAIQKHWEEKQTGPTQQLPETQIRILKLLQDGKTINEIGETVALTSLSVESLIDLLYTRTGTKTIEELLRYAKEKKMI